MALIKFKTGTPALKDTCKQASKDSLEIWGKRGPTQSFSFESNTKAGGLATRWLDCYADIKRERAPLYIVTEIKES